MTRQPATPAKPGDPPSARIVAELRRRIASGELRVGDRLPSTRQIARQWQVAIATATKVLTLLRHEGLVRALPGVGTVVVRTPRPAARPERRPGGRRPSAPGEDLHRDPIVQAAIELADAEGLAALSMRGVAGKLGVATMSLYRHVESKDDLISHMTDAVFGEARLPDTPPAGWRARLTVAARLQWSIYRRHPWLAQLVSITRPQPLRNLLVHGEWALAAIDGLGLDAATMLHVHVTLFSYVRGLAINIEWENEAEAASGLTEEEWMDAHSPALGELAASGAFPTFAKVLADLSDNYDLDLDLLFEFGLEPLLDGLAPLLDGTRARAAATQQSS
ncbi:TetR/AcrR family transcriptional regulator C-terminal domain-containing protein [Nannocystis sp. SCPEA4]|uniref:TetR/AcrR family transcriptional regulator C-terminal domain-containing protein n=1 Tax=Nannocystis sp. SCPEA4 TaxID=2996787 RepID=UPI00226EC0CD|nr:TetR/AcrR family transcriptional regulator C-terminal domain-containing protein [Nannocystis sp. SCPEA4]MCY1059351.1 TetR/AcrR family transcriptional regulator C-terminal domain-containing protein [Nannocystis sp. SCPEA4]